MRFSAYTINCLHTLPLPFSPPSCCVTPNNFIYMDTEWLHSCTSALSFAKQLHNHYMVSVHFNNFPCMEIRKCSTKNKLTLCQLSLWMNEWWLASCMHQQNFKLQMFFVFLRNFSWTLNFSRLSSPVETLLFFFIFMEPVLNLIIFSPANYISDSALPRSWH